LCDADGESVLPNDIFVEGAKLVQNKFKSSVAAALHRAGAKVPNWKATGFMPMKSARGIQWRAMLT
jgi:hypothetical protein